MRSDKHTDKETRLKRLKRMALILGAVVALILGAIVGYYGNQVRELLSDVSTGDEGASEETQDTSEMDSSLSASHPISILILGLDAEQGSSEARRSDSIMVATINPQEESVKLVSIPRDTLITLPEENRLEKFNAIYPVSGMDGLIEYVEDYLTIPISFYATLNFQGLVDLVNAVGGITVDSPLSFTVQDSEENTGAIAIEEGIQELNGEEALGYARMRRYDPRGDFGRQERQREVIRALADELLSFNSVTRLTPILNAVRPNLQTNMTGQQILTIATNYSSAAQDIDSVELSGEADYVYIPTYDQELYVWLPYEESLEDVRETLRDHMELGPLEEDPLDPATAEETPE